MGREIERDRVTESGGGREREREMYTEVETEAERHTDRQKNER